MGCKNIVIRANGIQNRLVQLFPVVGVDVTYVVEVVFVDIRFLAGDRWAGRDVG
jgi:hypothetical protein